MGLHTLSPKSINWDEIAAKHVKECQENGKDYIEKTVSEKPLPILPRRYLDYSFDNFQGGEKLINVLKRCMENKSNILLSGCTGSGKTHLAVACLREFNTSDGALFITVPELLMKARATFKENAELSEEQLVYAYTNRKLLCLDDLGAEKSTDYSITTLYLILNNRLAECHQTIITTNFNTLQEIENNFGARIASRLSEYEQIKINAPDWRKKR